MPSDLSLLEFLIYLIFIYYFYFKVYYSIYALNFIFQFNFHDNPEKLYPTA
jgi:hypothetical protein